MSSRKRFNNNAGSRRWRTKTGMCLVVALWGLVSIPIRSPAQETKEAQADALRQAELKLQLQHMRNLDLRHADSQAKAVPLIERPLLTYGEPTRANDNGSLWAWGESGRPVAFVEMWQPSRTDVWGHAVTLTAAHLATMKTPEPSRWQPEKTQISPARIADAPAPDEKEAVRLRQLKDLARRFTAHEFWNPDNSRYELRLLVQPIHRYNDPASEIQDGAVFILAHGTNPEIILLIEALGKSLGDAHWHYSLARSGSAELRVEIDGKEVWKQERTPNVYGLPSEPYWMFYSPMEKGK